MKELNQRLQEQFDTMSASGKLFRSSVTGQQVWDTYLNSFAEKNDPIFRDPNSTSHNCNHCKNFIRRYGNIVSVGKDYNIVTIFDVDITGEFEPVVAALQGLLKTSPIKEVFFETFDELNSLPYESCRKSKTRFQLGIDKNVKQYNREEAQKYGVVKEGEVHTFNHMHLFVDKEYVDTSGKSVEAIMGEYRDAKNVFQRGMETISLDTLNLVRDLINQGSLLDGTTHLYKIEAIIPLKQLYDRLSTWARADWTDNWCWVTSYGLNISKFRNELIGVLCSELSEGEELNKAVLAWNKRVDPTNYMKATVPVTKKQIEEAKRFVQDNGYEESFDRRFATLKDIKASEILHLNAGDGKVKTVSIFDNVKSTSTRHKRSEFDKVEEVSIDKFMKDILPGCTSVEAFLQNNHEGNMVSLTTSNIPESKPIFKWSNNYSWTFNGNLAGKSQIKQNVKSAGGKVDGILRASLQWNDEDTPGILDFDFHCKESKGSYIKFNNKRSAHTAGFLDVDMIRPSGIGIENITWQKQPKDMEYEFLVHNFDNGSNKGFKVEIEFNGELFNYHYQNQASGTVRVATVTVRDGQFSIKHHLPESSSSKAIYGLDTNQFHKVNLVCLSPNHWDDNSVGNKHYLFMLQDCKTDKSIRGFHNENLIPELAAHRKVLEVLSAQTMIEPGGNEQVSGLGFNSTVRDELVVRLQGTHKRLIRIRF